MLCPSTPVRRPLRRRRARLDGYMAFQRARLLDRVCPESPYRATLGYCLDLTGGRTEFGRLCEIFLATRGDGMASRLVVP